MIDSYNKKILKLFAVKYLIIHVIKIDWNLVL